MYGRAGGLDRFKKAQSLEPFAVAASQAKSNKTAPPPPPAPSRSHPSSKAYPHSTLSQSVVQPHQNHAPESLSSSTEQAPHVTQLGGGQSTWLPPDWAIEPRPGLLYLEVLKDGVVLDRINLHKRRHIFGRQFHACDFVLDHQSVSRQHAAVVPHKNGSVYVVDLGSAHGTFVANERLTKDNPIELEVGQSLRFAASTRTYVLRKDEAILFPPTPAPAEINLPPPPDPSDEEAVVAYNTLVNRYGINISELSRPANRVASSRDKDDSEPLGRPAKRIKKTRVGFRDQVGGELVEVVGVSDGADVETEPGPLGLKEGSLVGKYESLVQITVIPKGKEQPSVRDDNISPKGVTDKLQEVLNKVKSPKNSKSGIYDDLYGDISGKVGSSWAYSSGSSATREPSSSNSTRSMAVSLSSTSLGINSSAAADDDDDDDLFGD